MSSTSDSEEAEFNSKLRRAIREAVAATLDELDAKALPPRKRYQRAPAAADFIGVDVTTLANWRSKKLGPKFRRIGNRILYDTPDLIAFVEQSLLVGSGKLNVAGDAAVPGEGETK